MKTHLNTLFVTTQGAYLRKDGETVDVRVEKKSRLRVPLHNLDGIVGFGRVAMSPQLMGSCAESGVTISFLTIHGRFLAAVNGFTPGNVLLRRQQYRTSDDPVKAVEVARAVVAGKLGNCRTVLRRAARDTDVGERSEALNKAADKLTASLAEALRMKELDRLRGVEGEAATLYFGVMNQLLGSNDKEFQYTKRSRRPPLDRINAMLSFAYTLLMHDARSACEAAGLDTAVGFLHRDRPGRPGMALDLMEEFRPFLADRMVVSLINRQQVKPGDFTIRESGAVQMNDTSRKAMLVAWQQRKQEQITHPFLNEKTTVGLLLHLQARLMARYLRNDLDAYPPFVWK
ncbi:MAG: type I-C CRISPR-associated endonuclease Cas1 [Planctomycetota bacterium]|nr:MAG: type I-C CRISPR-associated endonuclease Cas1 [Planctomycetota bacterium]